MGEEMCARAREREKGCFCHIEYISISIQIHFANTRAEQRRELQFEYVPTISRFFSRFCFFTLWSPSSRSAFIYFRTICYKIEQNTHENVVLDVWEFCSCVCVCVCIFTSRTSMRSLCISHSLTHTYCGW